MRAALQRASDDHAAFGPQTPAPSLQLSPPGATSIINPAAAAGVATGPTTKRARTYARRPTKAAASPAVESRVPSLRLGDIAGAKDAKAVLHRCVSLHALLGSHLLVGPRRLPSSVLLYGPPGTGKTSLAQVHGVEGRGAAAHERGAGGSIPTPPALAGTKTIATHPCCPHHEQWRRPSPGRVAAHSSSCRRQPS